MRFSIRDVLWLTLVIGLLLSWLISRGEMAAREERVNKEYRKFYTLVLRKCDPKTIPPIEDFPIGTRLFYESWGSPPNDE